MATGSFERKSFTGGAAPTTLGANLGVGDTSITLADGSTYPTGATNPFVIVINRGTTTEEKILITSRSGNVLTVDTRGYDDGTDQAHTLGETVEHVLDASTVDQANRYVNLQTAKGDLVAHDGTNPNAVNVGTNGDVLAADSTATNGVAWTNRLTTAESEIDTLQSDVTTLQGTDFDVTLTGNVTGTGTSTNLGNVSIATTVADDSHNHVIGNIDNFTEEVQDVVGGMVTGNTESGITVTYQDADGTLDFDVNDPTISLTGDVTGSATMTNLGNVSIATSLATDSVDETHIENGILSFNPTTIFATATLVGSGSSSGVMSMSITSDPQNLFDVYSGDSTQVETNFGGFMFVAVASYTSSAVSVYFRDRAGAQQSRSISDDFILESGNVYPQFWHVVNGARFDFLQGDAGDQTITIYATAFLATSF